MAALSQMISLAVYGYIIMGELCSATCGKLEEAIVRADVIRDIFDRQKVVINSKSKAHVLSFCSLNAFDFHDRK